MKILKLASFILFISTIFFQTLYAQKTWEKDWQKWDKKDVYKIINDSPWAKSYNNIEVSYAYTGINRGGFDKGGQLGPAPPVTVRLYSSLKIRQALLRLRQIQAGYDNLEKKQKDEFNQANRNFLDCANCKNYYVFILLQYVEKPSIKSLIGDEFKDEKIENLKDKIYLTNEKGEKREMEQFVAPKTSADAAVFYFPIMDENQKPLITEQTKKMTLQVKTSLLRGKAFLQDVEFDISKMLTDGKLDF